MLTFWVKKSWNQEFGFKKYAIQDFGLLLDFSILESWIEDFGWLLDFSVPKSWIEDYNIRVALTLRRLLTNVKYKDKPEDRQRALYKIKCCDCQAFHIGQTGRNRSTWLTEHKRATRNGDVNNHIAEHHLKTKHQIDWDSATCITYSTDCYQRLTLESWFTNLEKTPLNRSQQLPAPFKRLVDDEIKQN